MKEYGESLRNTLKLKKNLKKNPQGTSSDKSKYNIWVLKIYDALQLEIDDTADCSTIVILLIFFVYLILTFFVLALSASHAFVISKNSTVNHSEVQWTYK